MDLQRYEVHLSISGEKMVEVIATDRDDAVRLARGSNMEYRVEEVRQLNAVGQPVGEPSVVASRCEACNAVIWTDQQWYAGEEADLCQRCATAPADAAVEAEPINHPAHYGGADNPYEAIKVIEAWGLSFHLGNTVKYISRAEKKGAPLTDLRKALWYLEREIARRERAA